MVLEVTLPNGKIYVKKLEGRVDSGKYINLIKFSFNTYLEQYKILQGLKLSFILFMVLANKKMNSNTNNFYQNNILNFLPEKLTLNNS